MKETTHTSGPVDYLALAIATFGVGFLPLAPGTWGSLVGVGIYLLLRYFASNSVSFHFSIELVVILVITFAESGRPRKQNE